MTLLFVAPIDWPKEKETKLEAGRLALRGSVPRFQVNKTRGHLNCIIAKKSKIKLPL